MHTNYFARLQNVADTTAKLRRTLLPAALVLALALALGACGGSDDNNSTNNNTTVSYTDNDGQPEITGQLAVPDSVEAGSTVTVTVPVDNDTTQVDAFLWDGGTSGFAATGQALQPFADQRADAPISVPSTVAVGTYYVQVTVTGAGGNYTSYAGTSTNYDKTPYNDAGQGGDTVATNITVGVVSVTAPTGSAPTPTPAGNPVSTSYNSPSTIVVDSSTTFDIAAGATGYITFTPSLDVSTPYGVYVTDNTNATSPLTMLVSYDSSGSPTYINSVGATNANTVTVAFRSGVTTLLHVVEVDNTSGGATNFSILTRKAASGGQTFGTAVSLGLGILKRIGGSQTDGIFKFTAGGTSGTFTFSELTYGVALDIYQSDCSTSVDSFASSTASVRNEVFASSSLTSSTTYCVHIRPYTATSAPVVGNLTVTSP